MRGSVSHRCRLFGVSRQAFYHHQHDAQRVRGHSLLVLDLVLALRREIPGLGTRKLYLLLQQPLAASGIKMGRDKLHQLLQAHDLILRQKRSVPKTTNAMHRLRKYPDLLVDIVLSAPQQVWVCDITYLCIFMHWAGLRLLILTDGCILETHRRLLPASAAHGGGFAESLGNGPAKRATRPSFLDPPLGPR